jgi:hypothetical protein
MWDNQSLEIPRLSVQPISDKYRFCPRCRKGLAAKYQSCPECVHWLGERVDVLDLPYVWAASACASTVALVFARAGVKPRRNLETSHFAA